MYKIGIIGNDEDRFVNAQQVKQDVRSAIELLKKQYDQLEVNISAHPGVGAWAIDACQELGVNYHLYLSKIPDPGDLFWEDFQEQKMQHGFCNAKCLTVNEDEQELYSHLVGNSNFLMVFWVGNKSGVIPDAIKNAFADNKIVIDGQTFKTIFKDCA